MLGHVFDWNVRKAGCGFSIEVLCRKSALGRPCWRPLTYMQKMLSPIKCQQEPTQTDAAICITVSDAQKTDLAN